MKCSKRLSDRCQAPFFFALLFFYFFDSRVYTIVHSVMSPAHSGAHAAPRLFFSFESSALSFFGLASASFSRAASFFFASFSVVSGSCLTGAAL